MNANVLALRESAFGLSTPHGVGARRQFRLAVVILCCFCCCSAFVLLA